MKSIMKSISEKSGVVADVMMVSSITVLLCGGILIVVSSLMDEPLETIDNASFAILLTGCGLFMASVVMMAFAEWAMNRGEG